MHIRPSFAAFAAALTLLASAAAAQMPSGVRSFTERTIQGAIEQREDQARQAGVDGDLSKTREQQREAANSARGIDHGWIERAAPNGKMVRLYVDHPFVEAGSNPKFPALIVIQEWWGVNRDIEQRTEAFAGKGYYAVAVDLYDGKHTSDPKQAAQYKNMLTDAAALMKLKVGLSYLMQLADAGVVDRNRVGAIGWCMGGHEAINLAVHDPRIKATCLYYGAPITDPKLLTNLKGPVLGIFGKEDTSISQATVDAFDKGLTDAGIKHTILRYDNAGHAFASPAAEAMGRYRPEAAKDANAKAEAWLKEHVMKEAPPATQPAAE